MKNLFKNFFAVMFLASLFSLSFTSCSDSDDDDFVPADKTELLALIAEYETLANSATETDYPADAISTFKSTITTIKEAAGKDLTELQVTNLTNQLEQAKKLFDSKAYGAIPEEALLIGLDFDSADANELITIGTRTLTAKLMTGPSEIFGTSTTKPTYVDGVKGGKAIKFANGSHLEISNYVASDFLANKLSIATWVKLDEVKAGNYIMSMNYWENWKFQLQEQSKPFMTIKTSAGGVDADNEMDQSAQVGQWVHLVVVYDLPAKKMFFYVNGVLTKTWTDTDKPNLTGSMAAAYQSAIGKQLPLLIGAATTYEEANAVWTGWQSWNSPTGWDCLSGALDNFKVYNIALDAGQVAKLYKDEK